MEPHLNASDWNAILSKHGFGLSNDTPGMAVDLRELNDSNTRVDGLEIRVVENENTMRIWAEIFTQEYGLPTDWAIVILDTWIKLGLDFPIRNYLGYLKDEPVSTSTIFFSEGVAGIYDVGTLPKARGRGIGGAMTLRPLHDAVENGYRIAILQSSEMGYSVYKKLGFRHLCQIENYYSSLE